MQCINDTCKQVFIIKTPSFLGSALNQILTVWHDDFPAFSKRRVSIGALVFKWSGMTVFEQSKDENIEVVGIWRAPDDRKVYHKTPFFIPFIDDIESIMYSGNKIFIIII